MNTTIIIIIVILIAAIYVYTFFISRKKHKISKKNINKGNTQQYQYHLPYQHRIQPKEPPKEPERYNNYITRYNSSEDYREKIQDN